jgi:hypothetical protein
VRLFRGELGTADAEPEAADPMTES